MTGPFSLLTVGGAQHAVSATDNSLQAETTQSTPTCSANGTHSDGYTGAFEGPEKLLEMWFAPTSSAARCVAPGAELCDEDHDQWSELRSGLSESSFFVYPNKLVLKTCGTTTLLYAIPRILAIAHQYLGATGVHQVFYSRKNFMFPDQQEELHRSWEKEVAFLDAHFPEGSAYMIGKTNRDHWHVYLCGPYETAAGGDARLAASPEGGDATASNSAEGSPIVHALSRSSSRSTVHSFIDSAVSVDSAAVPLAAAGDTTVEILMTGLDPDRMRAMYLGGVTACEGSSGGKAVERASGIANIYPDSVADSYLFTPCGFSLNGLQGDGYYTIHVTPEPHCSYASFETTINDQAIDLNSSAGIKLLVDKVAAVFGPASLTVTVFRARASADAVHDMTLSFGEGGKPDGLVKALATGQLPAADTFPPAFAPVQGYKSVDRVLYEFDHYWLRYAYYTKAD